MLTGLVGKGGAMRVVAYLDDVMIGSTDTARHLEHVEVVLQRLRDHGLRLAEAKVHVGYSTVRALGHVLSRGRVMPDGDKLAAVRDWPRPVDLAGVQRMMGFFNYFRDFVPGFGEGVEPLKKLLVTRPGEAIAWGEEQEESLRWIKAQLMAQPARKLPEPGVPFVLQCDASDVGTGAVLLQRGELVAAHSQGYNVHETRYPTREKEALAIFRGLKRFRHLLLGAGRTRVVTDHQSLTGLLQSGDLETGSGRLQRWADYMSAFDLEIVWAKGEEQVLPDALSRAPRKATMVAAVTRAGSAAPMATTTASTTAAAQPAQHEGEQREAELGPGQGSTTPAGALPGMTEATAPEAVLAQLPDVITEAKDAIMAAYDSDPDLSEVWAALGPQPPPVPTTGPLRLKLPWYRRQQGLLWRVDNVLEAMVPALPAGPWRQEMVRLAHDVAAGHLGRDRTLAALAPLAYWPRMASDVRAMVAACATCAVSKPLRRAYGVLQPLEVPQQPWQHLALDFFSMPEVEGHDQVMLWTCRFSKMMVAVPCRKSLTAEGAARLFMDHVYPRAGVPASITSDRDKLFTSALWTTFFKAVGTDVRMTTPAHAQGDGQSERGVQTLRQMLRAATGGTKPWPTVLQVVTAAYNNTPHTAHGWAPEFVANARHLRVLATYNTEPRNLGAMEDVATAANAVHALVARELQDASAGYALFYDRGREPTPDWPPHTPVWVRAVALGATPEATKALKRRRKDLPTWCGPFAVAERSSTNTYRISLPDSYRVHKNFNIKNLRRLDPRADQDFRPAPVYITDDGHFYEPEEVRDHRRSRTGKTELMVKWVGWPLKRDWEPIEAFRHVPQILAKYFGKDAVPSR